MRHPRQHILLVMLPSPLLLLRRPTLLYLMCIMPRAHRAIPDAMPSPFVCSLGFSSRYECMDDNATCFWAGFRLRKFSPEEAASAEANDWSALPWDLKVEKWSLCYSVCICLCWIRVLHIFFLRYLSPLLLPVPGLGSWLIYVWHGFLTVLTFAVCSNLGYIVSIFAW